jgi:membrane protein involved in colicin uptake
MKKMIAVVIFTVFVMFIVSCAAQKKAEFKKKSAVKVSALQEKIKAIEEKAGKAAAKKEKAALLKAAEGAKARLSDIQAKIDAIETVAAKDLDDFLSGMDAGMNNLSDNLEQFISLEEEKASEVKQE